MKKIVFNSVTKLFHAAPRFRELLCLRRVERGIVKAVDNVSFGVEESAVIGILGENGAGKTTLLKLLSGLLLPDSGEISVLGLNPGEHGREVKQKAGITLNQERSFYWRLTARENINFFASLHGIDRKTAEKRILPLFDILNIDESVYEKRFDELSSGMMKKFSIARALIHDPAVILLDEPAKSLDYGSALKFNAFIRDRLAKERGKIIFYISHDMGEIETLSDKVMILHKGRLLEFAALPELRKSCAMQKGSLADIFLRAVRAGRESDV